MLLDVAFVVAFLAGICFNAVLLFVVDVGKLSTTVVDVGMLSTTVVDVGMLSTTVLDVGMLSTADVGLINFIFLNPSPTFTPRDLEYRLSTISKYRLCTHFASGHINSPQ